MDWFLDHLSGKNIVVTGANGLLGSGLVSLLLGLNVRVIAVDRQDECKNSCWLDDNNFAYKKLDVSVGGDVESFKIDLAERYGEVFGIVVAHQFKPEGFLNKDELSSDFIWNEVINANLTGSYNIINRLYPLVPKGGSIIMLGSTYGDVSSNPYLYEDNEMGNPAVYSASKGGIKMLVKYYGVHLAKKGIRVNLFTPHGIENGHSAKFLKRFSSLSPTGRMMSVEEACAPILFLLSDRSSYCVASELKADGGWTSW